MKKPTFQIFFTLILFQLVCISTSQSQTMDKPLNKVYLFLGTGPTTDNGILYDIGVQASFKNNWIGSISYSKIEMNPKNTPSDYEPGYTEIIIPFPDEYPHVDLKIISFSAGKRFDAGRKIWFTTEAGVSIVSGQEFTFTKQPVTTIGNYTTSNYSVETQSKTTVGGLLRADVIWAFTPYVGVGAGAFINISSFQTPIGGQIKLILGWLNTKKKNVQ